MAHRKQSTCRFLSLIRTKTPLYNDDGGTKVDSFGMDARHFSFFYNHTMEGFKKKYEKSQD